MDNKEIVELLFRRDERAVEELRQKYEGLCLRIAGNLLAQREDAEECVSSAWFEVWNSIPPARPEDLRTYLCRIVRNIAINRLKYNSAEKRSPALAVSLEELADCVPAAVESDRLLAETISLFLRNQDEAHRRVFIRRYWYGDTVEMIAESCRMNSRTVATYLFRTRNRLREYLKKEGYNYD